MPSRKFALATVLAVMLASVACRGDQPAPFAEAARVVFLGDSITYAGGYIDTLETWLLARYPDQTVEIINLGLPSETVSGLTEPDHPFPRPDVHERLDRALAKTEPDVVVACYGMNDGIYHPYSDERAAAYHDGIDRLIAKVEDAGARLILMTPPPFEASAAGDSLVDATAPEFGYKTPFREYDAVIARYGGWLLDERSEAVAAVIDLHGPLSRRLADARRVDPAFAMTGDGVHPNAAGHWLIAKYLIAALSDDGTTDSHSIDWPEGQGDVDVRWMCRVSGPARPGADIAALGDDDLLEPGDGHTLRVAGAPPGSYAVFEGNSSLGEFTAAELNMGVDVRRFVDASINQTSHELATTVRERQVVMRNAWLSHVGHQRPGTAAGMPLDVAQAKAVQLATQIEKLRRPQTLRLRIVRE